MIRSMTAFARGDTESAGGTLAWELRSVNHRFLEIGLKLPDDLRGLESQIRDLINERMLRGRVDGTLRWRPGEAPAGEATLSEPSLSRLLGMETRVRELRPDSAPLSVADILQWPGVIEVPEIDVDSLGAAAMALLRRTIDELFEGRAREGARLDTLIRERLATIRELIARLRPRLTEIEEAVRARLDERLANAGVEAEPGRLEQEIVLLLNRADVSEEVDRIDLHVDEVERVLGQKGSVGRRLDFLMQELNREANTLGSKSAHPLLTNTSVELKVLIEQMREQVQNIE